MALQYLFDPNKQFQSIGGVNEVGGFLRVYLNGTDDRAVTYRNFDGGLNEPDIVLDTYGRSVVIVDETKTYRLEVYNRLGGLMWTISNYKARGGSGGGSGTPVSVEGTAGEIDVYENTVGGVKHFIVSLAANVKNAISSLTSAVNGIALSLGNKKERQTAKEFIGSTTKTIVGVTQNEDGEVSVSFGDIPLDNYELKENKKTTVTSYEGSNTYYPTIKAVVDFVNGMMQNLGGKLITDNGDPFASSADLPSSTPYQGVDIADKDYAYIQGLGTAERWSATVSGTSVSWLQEYAISIPVFTPQQQAAIDSGVTAEMLGSFLTKTGDGSNVTATFTAAGSRTNISTGEKLSVIFGKIAKWFADLKAVAFSGSYSDLSDKPAIPAAAKNGVLTLKQNGTSVGTFSANQSGNTDINVTDTTYESKSEASGGTAVSLVTTGEKYTWNHKQNALPTSGTPSNTYAINISGTAKDILYNTLSANATNTKAYQVIGKSTDRGTAGRTTTLLITDGDIGGLQGTYIVSFSYRSEPNVKAVALLSPTNINKKMKFGYYVSGDYCYLVASKPSWTSSSRIHVLEKDEHFEIDLGNNTSTMPSGYTDGLNLVNCNVQAQVGSTRLPIFVNEDGTFSPINIDEYYCWAHPTPQWTDVMEMSVWYVQNECNNEILGSVRNINLNATHPSLCYLHVKLPTLEGAGRYRFTLEFEITNSNGQNGTSAYGVLLLDPPTGYSGEPFLAECCYDSSGRAQSSVMNQIHVPPQGYTYRHKLYVDGHTYRVVKTK